MNFALEIMAKGIFKVKHLEGDTIEFLVSEQVKQALEYDVLAEPNTKVDYAKLVQFLGVRETLNNIWSVDQYFEEDLLDDEIRSCGNFLSIVGEGKASQLSVIKENKEFDFYYSTYQNHQADMIDSFKGDFIDGKDATLISLLYSKYPERK